MEVALCERISTKPTNDIKKINPENELPLGINPNRKNSGEDTFTLKLTLRRSTGDNTLWGM